MAVALYFKLETQASNVLDNLNKNYFVFAETLLMLHNSFISKPHRSKIQLIKLMYLNAKCIISPKHQSDFGIICMRHAAKYPASVTPLCPVNYVSNGKISYLLKK